MIVDRDKALEMIEDNPENFKMCSNEIKNDPNFFDKAIGTLGRECNYYVSDAISDLIRNAGVGITNNKSYIFHLLDEMNAEDLKYISKILRRDEEFMLRAIRTDGEAFLYAGDKLKDDRNFIIKSVKTNSVVFKYLNDEYKNDIEIAGIVIRHNPVMFKYAGEKIFNSFEYTREMMKEEPYIFKYINDDFRDALTLEAVKVDGRLFRYASDRYKDNEDVTLQAMINSRGIAYDYASERVKNSSDFCQMIIMDDGDEMARFYNGVYKKIMRAALKDEALSKNMTIEMAREIIGSKNKTLRKKI